MVHEDGVAKATAMGEAVGLGAHAAAAALLLKFVAETIEHLLEAGAIEANTGVGAHALLQALA